MIAIDQYGSTHFLKGKYPRKELLNLFNASKADKMYIDSIDGKAECIGYIIKGLWLKLYKLEKLNLKIRH